MQFFFYLIFLPQIFLSCKSLPLEFRLTPFCENIVLLGAHQTRF
jgi:hypothetical protein